MRQTLDAMADGMPPLRLIPFDLPRDAIRLAASLMGTVNGGIGTGTMRFTDQQVAQVWQKATYIDDAHEKNGFRKDQCGAWIKRSDYGKRDSQ